MKKEFSFEKVSRYDLEFMEKQLNAKSPVDIDVLGLSIEENAVCAAYVRSDGNVNVFNCIDKENAFEDVSNIIADIRKRMDPFEEKKIKLAISVPTTYLDQSEDIMQSAYQEGMHQVKIVPKPVAVVTAYENTSSDYALSEGEIGLVYDWGSENVTISLLKKENHGLKILYQDMIKNPAFYDRDSPIVRGSLLDILKTQMCRKFMLDDKAVDFISITGIGPANTKVWEEFYNSAENVLDSLLNGKDAKLKVGDFLASIEETYTQEDFAKIIKPFYEKTEILLKNVLENQHKTENNISKVYLSGRYSNVTLVQKALNDFLGEKVFVEKNTKWTGAIGVAYIAQNI